MTSKPPKANYFFDEDGMLLRVQENDIDLLRSYFERALSGEGIYRPTWRHLRCALENNNLPMMRLLVTWGATLTAEDLSALAADRPETREKDVTQLRLAGLNIRALPAPIAVTEADRYAFYDPALIPDEWKKVLNVFKANGAPEAMIIGGALRDTFNKKQIKDVDIFLHSPMFGHEKMLKKIFAKTGLHLYQYLYDPCYADTFTSSGIRMEGYSLNNTIGKLESWRTVAGPDMTAYNIVFVKGPHTEFLRKAAKSPANYKAAIPAFLAKMDVGLCQIGFDGAEVVTTQAYKDDLKNKRLTLCNIQHSSIQHLDRLAIKYEGWELCPAFKKAIEIGSIRLLEAENNSQRRHAAQYMQHAVFGRAYM